MQPFAHDVLANDRQHISQWSHGSQLVCKIPTCPITSELSWLYNNISGTMHCSFVQTNPLCWQPDDTTAHTVIYRTWHMVMVTIYITSLLICYTILSSLEYTHSTNKIYTKHDGSCLYSLSLRGWCRKTESSKPSRSAWVKCHPKVRSETLSKNKQGNQ